ncbi:uncharacterized protein LOC111803552 [Cucurbita pepo subsp. pepo]|uniref:uncharacterized protein LOC111803552 n=1 Tax=Cucurbita pepo subsp. pepo TaxID=3664 RepID=UPI000C9D7BF8|nr:uncharacterized protein LOC111803552 [Cucurbita pepo subsp. pepo]
MGNCVEVLSRRREEEGTMTTTTTTTMEKEERKGGVRIKVVLTKEELQWLMEQVQERGGKGLEELLGEIERRRRKVDEDGSWRPSLESIMEVPEVPDRMEPLSS